MANEVAFDYLKSSLEQFISLFPNLRLDDEKFASQKVDIGSQKSSCKTFLAFVRQQARNGFKKRLLTRR